MTKQAASDTDKHQLSQTCTDINNMVHWDHYMGR